MGTSGSEGMGGVEQWGCGKQQPREGEKSRGGAVRKQGPTEDCGGREARTQRRVGTGRIYFVIVGARE